MCIDLNKLNKRVDLLKQGKVLYLQHMYYGTYKVYMNPQRNRILREGICDTAKRRTNFNLTYVSTSLNEINGMIEDPQRGTSEKDISNLLLWNCGRWFLEVGNTSGVLKVREV